MKKLLCILASTALIATACTKDNAGSTGQGSLQIAGAADTSIDLAADSQQDTRAITVPAPADFALAITGTSGTQTWPTVAAYTQSEVLFVAGDYTVTITHGDPDAEGLNLPYYVGSTSVTVIPRRTVTAEIEAKIGNSQVVVRTTPRFLEYFHNAAFKITTGSGNDFSFSPANVPADEPVFVKAATSIAVNGTATRQSPTGVGEGPSVTFGTQTLAATKAHTCHIFTFDATDAGGATLTITLGEELTETRTLDVELNDAATNN